MSWKTILPGGRRLAFDPGSGINSEMVLAKVTYLLLSFFHPENERDDWQKCNLSTLHGFSG